MTRVEKAQLLHQKRYNCCQAVALAFSDVAGVDEQTLFRLCEGFGLGMGNTKGICGALSAAILLAGLKNSDGNLETPASKQATYAIASALYDAFLAKTGSCICGELKGISTGKPLCSCADCIRIAAEITADVLHLAEN